MDADAEETFGKRISMKEKKSNLSNRRDYYSTGNLRDTPGNLASIETESTKDLSQNLGSGILMDYLSKIEYAYKHNNADVLIVRCSAESQIFKLSDAWDTEKYPSSLLGKMSPSEFRKNMSCLNRVITEKHPSRTIIIQAALFALAIFVPLLVIIILKDLDFAIEAAILLIIPISGFIAVGKFLSVRLAKFRISELQNIVQDFNRQFKAKGIEWRFRRGVLIAEPTSPASKSDKENTAKMNVVYEEDIDVKQESTQIYWIVEISITQAPRSQATIKKKTAKEDILNAKKSISTNILN